MMIPKDDPLNGRLLTRAACGCADHILEHYLRFPVSKERLSLSTPGDFDVAVARLSDELQTLAASQETLALRSALRVLDVDWSDTTPEQRRKLIDDAERAAGAKLGQLPQAVAPALQGASRRVVVAARDAAREEGLAIGVGFTAFDARVMRFLTRSETLFVRDATGRRLDHFAKAVRAVVAEGMAEGLGRGEIAANVARGASTALLERSQAYWQVVAGAFIGRGRSYAQMGAYDEADVGHYRIVAVMDERTSSVCRAMHGKILSVARALHLFEQAEAKGTAVALKAINPWPHSTDAIDSLSFPPFHGLCRTTTVAVV